MQACMKFLLIVQMEPSSIKHEARNRNDFAKGALQCGKWLLGKKGFFTIDDYVKEKLNAN